MSSAKSAVGAFSQPFLSTKSVATTLATKLTHFVKGIWFGVASSRAVQKFRTLLRTLGLGIVTFLRGHEDEPAKVLIDSSRPLALARCAIHIVPAFLSIALITLNLTGYFIGDELQGDHDEDDLKLGLLQIGAKVQELLVVASFGSVIFHVLRSELVCGDGVPLGLLVSGWTFAQVNYFWSAEFWGGMRCTQIMSRKQRWRRRGFVALVLIGGSLALLAGPATALLMIPRSQDWPVGGGIFWLNGSNDQLWPTNLDAGYYTGVNCSDQTIQFLDNRCPAAGFLPLYQHYNTWYKRQNTGYSFELRDSNLRKSMYARPSLISDANTWSFTAHAATATLQDAMRGLHNDALIYLSATHPQEPPFPGHLMWAELMRFEVETKVPAVRVLCEPQGMLDLSADNLTMKFPNIAAYDAYWLGRPPPLQRSPFPAPKVDLVDILEPVQRHLFARGILHNQKALLSDDIFSQNRSTLIIPIDMKEHSESALGLAMFFGTAWNRTDVDGNLLPSNSLACSVDARWANAKTVMEMTANTQLDHEYTLGRVRNLVETDLPFSHLIGYYRWKPPPMPVVRMSPSWYDLLAPVLPDAQSSAAAGLPWMPALGSKQTALEAVLSMTYKPVDSGQTEFEGLLATTLADGLSRCGLIPNHNGSRFLEAWQFGAWDTENEDQARTMIRKGNPVESFPEPSILKSGNLTRMEMKATYKGYVMSATGWFDYLSIAALLFHAIIALLHTILVVYHGKTSGAWDTILELVILAQMSSPPQESLLVNASAGIRSFKTVKLVAWVEAPQQGRTGHESGAELQMRFRDHMDHRDADLKPSVGKVYGGSVN